MKPFLELYAQIILEKHSIKNLRNIEIVLPSQRAVLYFKNTLSGLSSTPFFGPKITSIDDFITKLSKLTVLDNVSLYFKLFDLFKSIDADLKFDKFVNWAPILLKDFDNIDLALVKDPHLLFRYMSEAEALKRWDIANLNSANLGNYFNFFEHVSIVYQQLNENLWAEKSAYKGMAYKMAAEMQNLELQAEKIYFVGLNALSIAEETLIKKLVKGKMAECIWDTDEYYMNSDNKAGKKLRTYKKSGKFGVWNEIGNDLLTSTKTINSFEVSNESIQSKLAIQLAKENPNEKHAIIVLNENQFLPLMTNLPSLGLDFNITMGLPLNTSKLNFLISEFVDQQIGKSTEKLPFSYFIKVLQNPVVSAILNDEIENFSIKTKQLIQSKPIFVNLEFLIKKGFENEFLSLLFITHDVKSIIKAIYFIINKALRYINNKTDLLEFEFVNIFKSKIILTQEIAETRQDLSILDLKFLFNELLKNEKIPFDAASNANLQVMSMLETRCLDFDTVTFLSLNEGNLPSSQKTNSLIPFEAFLFFEMPVYTDQDAIMAYHFFRVLQKAKNVNFIYLKNAGGEVGFKEKSSLIMEVEEELLPKNKNLIFNKLQLKNEGNSNISSPKYTIDKSPEIIAKIKKFLETKGISPSNFNDLIKCQLKFYWKYIEHKKSEEQLESNFKANVFGNILHACLEELEKPFLNKSMNLNDLRAIQESIPEVLNNIIIEKYNTYETKTGLNSVLLSIALQVMQKYFSLRIKEFTHNIEILAIEQEYTSVLNFNIGNENVPLKLFGRIDKIEKIGNEVYLIDYKTGSVKEEQFKPSDKIENIFNEKKSILRQLVIYYYLISEHPTLNLNQSAIIPKVVSFQKLNEKYELNTEKIEVTTLKEMVENLIEEKVSELLDMQQSISQTTDTAICSFCDYSIICNR